MIAERAKSTPKKTNTHTLPALSAVGGSMQATAALAKKTADTIAKITVSIDLPFCALPYGERCSLYLRPAVLAPLGRTAGHR
jgi:hypothetical protein